jgi:hypothetical protein
VRRPTSGPSGAETAAVAAADGLAAAFSREPGACPTRHGIVRTGVAAAHADIEQPWVQVSYL